MQTGKYAAMIVLMSLVWLAVARENPHLPLNQTQIISYFFLAAMLYSLSNFHTYYIEDDIKLGFLSKFLLRPISAFWYYFTFQAGHALTETVIKALAMLPLLYAFGITLPLSITRLSLVLLYLPVIFSFAFTLFTIISTLTFWITESWAIRWTSNILFRFLAGIFVPITFFSSFWQNILWWLPFGHLANTPIQMLVGAFSIRQGIEGFLILTGWLLVAYLTQVWLWKKGLHSYEGTGI